MAWEERNGRLYYYRKRRVGSHVVSEYIGSGSTARIAAEIDDLKRDKRKLQREIWVIQKAQNDAMDKEFNSIINLIMKLTHATLLIAGFHTHKRQWRKRRELKSN